MTEQWMTNFITIVLGMCFSYVIGLRAGKVGAYQEEILYHKTMEQELLKIIDEHLKQDDIFINRQEDALEKINEAISGRAE